MFSYFEPNCCEKFLSKNGKFKFWSHDTFRETKFVSFWLPFWNSSFFSIFFSWFKVVFGAYRYSASFVPNSYGKNLKMVWSKWTPCAQTGVKNILDTLLMCMSINIEKYPINDMISFQITQLTEDWKTNLLQIFPPLLYFKKLWCL